MIYLSSELSFISVQKMYIIIPTNRPEHHKVCCLLISRYLLFTLGYSVLISVRSPTSAAAPPLHCSSLTSLGPPWTLITTNLSRVFNVNIDISASMISNIYIFACEYEPFMEQKYIYFNSFSFLNYKNICIYQFTEI